MFRNLVHSLSKAFQDGSALPPIGLISFIWILVLTDQPLTPGTLIGAGIVALLAMWLIGWLAGTLVVLMDGVLDIIDDVRRDIRATSDTTDTPPRRPLP